VRTTTSNRPAGPDGAPEADLSSPQRQPALSFFDRALSDAAPLTPARERELALRIESLALERAALVVTLPEAAADLEERVARRLDSRSQSAEALREAATLKMLGQNRGKIEVVLGQAASEQASVTQSLARLAEIGLAIASDEALRGAHLISSRAIDSYIKNLRAPSAPDTAPSSLEHENLTALRRAIFAQTDRLAAAADPLIAELITANLRLVRAVAGKFKVHHEVREELIAAGHLTLIRCAREFRGSYETRFSTYAFKSIEHAMFSTLAERRSEWCLSRPGSSSEDRTFCSSLFRPFNGSETSGEFIESIADPDSIDPHRLIAQRYDTALSSAIVHQALEKMPPEDRALLAECFGLNSPGAQTLKELANERGISLGALRTQLDGAQRRLRAALRADSAESLAALGLEDDAEISDEASNVGRRCEPHPAPHERHSESRPIRRRPARQTEPANRPPPPRGRLSPGPALFTVTDHYTAALTAIRRTPTEMNAPVELCTACFAELSSFHRALLDRWPEGHAQKRYGFALEEEMIKLRGRLSGEQIEVLRRAIGECRAALERQGF